MVPGTAEMYLGQGKHSCVMRLYVYTDLAHRITRQQLLWA